MKRYAKSYDHLAASYVWLERLAFGNGLQRARLHYLEQLASAQRLLLLGEGDGRFLQHLLQVNPKAAIDAVDNSPAMLRRSKQRLQQQGLGQQVRFIHADARSYPYPTAQYDAVVTLFFLDNFRDNTLAALIPQLADSLRSGGYWYIADFHPANTLRRALWLGLMYSFFACLTDIPSHSLHAPQPWLERAGLQRLAQQDFAAGLYYSSLWRKGGSSS